MSIDIELTPQRRFIRENKASKGWVVEYAIYTKATAGGEEKRFHNIKLWEIYYDKDDKPHPSMSQLNDQQRQRGTLNRQMNMPIQLIPSIMEAMAELYEENSPNYAADAPEPGKIMEAKVVKRTRAKKADAQQEAAIEDFSEFGASKPKPRETPPNEEDEAPF